MSEIDDLRRQLAAAEQARDEALKERDKWQAEAFEVADKLQAVGCVALKAKADTDTALAKLGRAVEIVEGCRYGAGIALVLRDFVKVGKVRGSLPDNEEGRLVNHQVDAANAPHEPSQCCQSAARTALLEAAEEMRTAGMKNGAYTAEHVAEWLTTRAGGPKV